MEKLPPIQFANGQRLDTALTTGRSGVNRILFSDDGGHVKGRVSYHQLDDEAHFAGMLFRGAPPDYAAGRSIIAYFFETALPSLDLEPGETSIIRKPIIALELARYGLAANLLSETHSVAGLLTPGIDSRRGRPALHFISGNEAEFSNPAHNRYYDIVPNRELPYLYPLQNPSRCIDMHTSYHP